MAANDKKGRRRRLPSNANPRLPSRAWTLNRPSGQQGEPAWITRRRQTHHLTTQAAAKTARDTIPARHPNRKQTRMTDYPRPGHYHAPDYIRTAARDMAGRAVRDMVLRLSGDPRARIELPPPAQHTADLADAAPAGQPRSRRRTGGSRPRSGRRANPPRPPGRPHLVPDRRRPPSSRTSLRQQGISRRRSLQLRAEVSLHRQPSRHHLDLPRLPAADHRPRPLG